MKIRKIRKGRAVGPDQISIELLEALGEDGVDLLHGFSTRYVTPVNYPMIF